MGIHHFDQVFIDIIGVTELAVTVLVQHIAGKVRDSRAHTQRQRADGGQVGQPGAVGGSRKDFVAFRVSGAVIAHDDRHCLRSKRVDVDRFAELKVDKAQGAGQIAPGHVAHDVGRDGIADQGSTEDILKRVARNPVQVLVHQATLEIENIRSDGQGEFAIGRQRGKLNAIRVSRNFRNIRDCHRSVGPKHANVFDGKRVGENLVIERDIDVLDITTEVLVRRDVCHVKANQGTGLVDEPERIIGVWPSGIIVVGSDPRFDFRSNHRSPPVALQHHGIVRTACKHDRSVGKIVMVNAGRGRGIDR